MNVGSNPAGVTKIMRCKERIHYLVHYYALGLYEGNVGYLKKMVLANHEYEALCGTDDDLKRVVRDTIQSIRLMEALNG